MCYDIQAKLEAQLKRARRLNHADLIRELETELEPYITSWHHVSGFAHPNVLIYTNEKPNIPCIAKWGLIPEWIKDEQQATKISQNTINARSESIFEKPAFSNSAKHQRCILSIDGFFEHHHKNGKAFPYFIKKQNGKPMNLAGLWSHWINKNTGERIKSFTIVTVKANQLMAKIHNNPKLKESRMPLLLTDEEADQWLQYNYEQDADRIKKIMKPSNLNLLAYTVRPLRGKKALGNTPKASEKYLYDELNTLF